MNAKRVEKKATGEPKPQGVRHQTTKQPRSMNGSVKRPSVRSSERTISMTTARLGGPASDFEPSRRSVVSGGGPCRMTVAT